MGFITMFISAGLEGMIRWGGERGKDLLETPGDSATFSYCTSLPADIKREIEVCGILDSIGSH